MPSITGKYVPFVLCDNKQPDAEKLHGSAGKQNVCFTGELSQNLSPTDNICFLLTHILQRHKWIPSLPEH